MNPQPIVDFNREGKGRTVDAGGPELGGKRAEHGLVQRPAQRLEAAEDLAAVRCLGGRRSLHELLDR